MALSDQDWQTLRECIVGELDEVPPESLTLEMLLMEDLEYDSLLAANLAFDLEDKFEILIDEVEIANVRSVGDLADLICRGEPACGDHRAGRRIVPGQ